MSQFTEEPPETLEDWNAILFNDCCCPMPECPVPAKECEYKSGSKEIEAYYPLAQPAGISGDDDLPRLYKSYSTPLDTFRNGRAVRFDSSMVSPTPPYDGWEKKWIGVFTATSEADEDYTSSGDHNSYSPPGTCVSAVDTTYAPSYEGNPYVESIDCTLTETRRDHRTILTYQSGGTEPELVGCPGPFSGSGVQEWWDGYTTTRYLYDLAEPFTKEDLSNEAQGEFGPVWNVGSSCASSLSVSHDATGSVPRWPLSSDAFEDGAWPDCEATQIYGVGVSGYAVKSRFRWTIPDTFEGTYFKITWDIVFFPTTGDPVAVTTDATWEWTGPGDPEDEESWKSGWYEISVPAEPGENRVVNIRFECYRSPQFGNKPQVTGEAVDLPPP